MARAVEVFFMVAGVLAVLLAAFAAIAALESGRKLDAILPPFVRPLPPPRWLDFMDQPFDVAHEKPEPGERVLFWAFDRWHVGELIASAGSLPGWWDGSSWFNAEHVRWWLELPPDAPK